MDRGGRGGDLRHAQGGAVPATEPQPRLEEGRGGKGKSDYLLPKHSGNVALRWWKTG